MNREFFHTILIPVLKALRFSDSWRDVLGPGRGQTSIVVLMGSGGVGRKLLLSGSSRGIPEWVTGQYVPSF